MTGTGGEPWWAVDAFLTFVLRRERTTRDDWPELARLLDQLALARHACPPPDYPDRDDEAGAAGRRVARAAYATIVVSVLPAGLLHGSP